MLFVIRSGLLLLPALSLIQDGSPNIFGLQPGVFVQDLCFRDTLSNHTHH